MAIFPGLSALVKFLCSSTTNSQKKKLGKTYRMNSIGYRLCEVGSMVVPTMMFIGIANIMVSGNMAINFQTPRIPTSKYQAAKYRETKTMIKIVMSKISSKGITLDSLVAVSLTIDGEDAYL